MITTFPATQGVCTALASCATFAYASPGQYFSFSLYFLKSTGAWQCVAWYGAQNDASAWNVQSDDVVAGFGYSLGNA
jgi:hypothetical protein